ncbi:hypothetical protein NDU88_002598 [Pleurodeles waltl]|uniref:Uncharacterized protein n=1 Tax=Pleurodeles waltl TaxID=8319 RepID=A0AAV7UZC5_PLEWA|nr:hypothetical protein NDU88_002598 [Pleurodeles waltl]
MARTLALGMCRRALGNCSTPGTPRAVEPSNSHAPGTRSSRGISFGHALMGVHGQASPHGQCARHLDVQAHFSTKRQQHQYRPPSSTGAALGGRCQRATRCCRGPPSSTEVPLGDVRRQVYKKTRV